MVFFGLGGCLVSAQYPNDLCAYSGLHEDISSNSDPILEGVIFAVSYLGSCLVAKPTGEETTSAAVKTILKMVQNK